MASRIGIVASCPFLIGFHLRGESLRLQVLFRDEAVSLGSFARFSPSCRSMVCFMAGTGITFKMSEKILVVLGFVVASIFLELPDDFVVRERGTGKIVEFHQPGRRGRSAAPP